MVLEHDLERVRTLNHQLIRFPDRFPRLSRKKRNSSLHVPSFYILMSSQWCRHRSLRGGLWLSRGFRHAVLSEEVVEVEEAMEGFFAVAAHGADHIIEAFLLIYIA